MRGCPNVMSPERLGPEPRAARTAVKAAMAPPNEWPVAQSALSDWRMGWIMGHRTSKALRKPSCARPGNSPSFTWSQSTSPMKFRMFCDPRNDRTISVLLIKTVTESAPSSSLSWTVRSNPIWEAQSAAPSKSKYESIASSTIRCDCSSNDISKMGFEALLVSSVIWSGTGMSRLESGTSYLGFGNHISFDRRLKMRDVMVYEVWVWVRSCRLQNPCVYMTVNGSVRDISLKSLTISPW